MERKTKKKRMKEEEHFSRNVFSFCIQNDEIKWCGKRDMLVFCIWIGRTANRVQHLKCNAKLYSVFGILSNFNLQWIFYSFSFVIFLILLSFRFFFCFRNAYFCLHRLFHILTIIFFSGGGISIIDSNIANLIVFCMQYYNVINCDFGERKKREWNEMSEKCTGEPNYLLTFSWLCGVTLLNKTKSVHIVLYAQLTHEHTYNDNENENWLWNTATTFTFDVFTHKN